MSLHPLAVLLLVFCSIREIISLVSVVSRLRLERLTRNLLNIDILSGTDCQHATPAQTYHQFSRHVIVALRINQFVPRNVRHGN